MGTISFTEKVRQLTRQKDSLVCVGLDVVVEKLPEVIGRDEDAIVAFNKAIIEATSDLALAYKLNFAFYEAYGLKGWRALEATASLIPDHCIKIGDAKRGDIGNTSRMYARAIFETLDFDAMTASPFLGADSVSPFLEDTGKGVFFLCLTSNPGSKDFQHFENEGGKLYEFVAEKIVSWNENDNCGLVVGATHPGELREIRAIAAELPFLIPGIGAQGGDLEKSVSYGTDDRGELAIINSSRGIIFKSSGRDFAEAARKETERLRTAINHARRSTSE